jgi:hypothetical protein
MNELFDKYTKLRLDSSMKNSATHSFVKNESTKKHADFSIFIRTGSCLYEIQ